jgi:hypothetical protein
MVVLFSVFWLKPIFNTAPAASKNNAQFKSGQNQHCGVCIKVLDTLKMILMFGIRLKPILVDNSGGPINVESFKKWSKVTQK